MVLWAQYCGRSTVDAFLGLIFNWALSKCTSVNPAGGEMEHAAPYYTTRVGNVGIMTHYSHFAASS